MPIKVTCSSCGRTGRVPDHASRTECPVPRVWSPSQTDSRRLGPREGPAGVEELEVLDEEPAGASPSGEEPRVQAGRVDQPSGISPQERTAPRPKPTPENPRSTNLNPLTLGLSLGVGVLSRFLWLISCFRDLAGSPKAEEQAAGEL